MKIKYYGTGASEGIPALFCKCPVCEEARKNGGRDIRSRSQALINDDLLVDFPPDTFMHIVYGGLDLQSIHTCLITHSHSDHLYVEDKIPISILNSNKMIMSKFYNEFINNSNIEKEYNKTILAGLVFIRKIINNE